MGRGEEVSFFCLAFIISVLGRGGEERIFVRLLVVLKFWSLIRFTFFFVSEFFVFGVIFFLVLDYYRCV